MRPLARVWVALGLTAMLVPGVGRSEEGPPRRCHPWGCFSPGAWKLARVVTETLDEKGAVISTVTTESTTTLNGVDKNGLALLIEAVVEVAGKRVEAAPQCVQQDFLGVASGSKAKVKDLEAAQVLIDGRKVPVRVREIEESGATSKTVTKVYISDTVAPYVLRRESVTTDLEGKTQLSETTMSVTAIDLPWKVLSEIKSAAMLHTVSRHPKGVVDTWSVVSPDVPGGVVCHASKELDENGRLVRRSSLELVDYALQPDEQGRGLFPRIRANRPHKTHRN